MTTEEILKFEKLFAGITIRLEALSAEMVHLKGLRVSMGNIIAESKGINSNGGFPTSLGNILPPPTKV